MKENNIPQEQPVQTGNASNPSPKDEVKSASGPQQLLDKKAEKYLRESANIEDMPDAQDQQEMDKVREKNEAS